MSPFLTCSESARLAFTSLASAPTHERGKYSGSFDIKLLQCISFLHQYLHSTFSSHSFPESGIDTYLQVHKSTV